MIPSKLQNQNILFLTSLAIAILVHVGALFTINGVKMHFVSNDKSLFENTLEERLVQRDAEAQSEMEKRNQQLDAAFKIITVHPKTTLYHQKTENLPELSDAQTLPDVNVSMDLPPENRIIKADISLFNSTEGTTAPNSENSEENNLSLKSTQIVFPGTQRIARELLQATDALQGVVLASTPEIVDTENAISAGRPESTPILGNALETQSGLLNTVANETENEGALEEKLREAIEALNREVQRNPTIRDYLAIDDPSNEPITLLGEENYETITTRPQGNIASSNDFTLHVDYAPAKNGEGYIYRIKMNPKRGTPFKRIKQNFFFLLDRSYSIPRHRYAQAKLAVARALTLLHPEDTFNILLFDSKIKVLSPQNLNVTPSSITKAHDFLVRESHGGLFASTDLYSSLDAIVPAVVPEREVNTAILISDGDTALTKSQKRETIALWTKKNAGKVSLYSLASGRGNNIALMDLLSTLNKGVLSYSVVDEGLQDKLAFLINTIQNPIGKDITATVVAPSPNLKVSLYPSSQCLPNLYEDLPFVLYGSVNKLEEFTLFLQGRYYEKWLDIKLKVTFPAEQKKDRLSLDKMWAIQRAYAAYQRYLAEDNPHYLERAKMLLIPYHIPLAF